MNKMNVLKVLLNNQNEMETAKEFLYRGKVFVVCSHVIKKYFKTKRGAEGYINKNKNFSYYDDYSQELVFPNSDLEIFEIKEDELNNTQAVEEKKDIETKTEAEESKTEEVKEEVTNTSQEKNINVEVKFNSDKNGIELYFNDKPSEEIRQQIKANGFRWSKYQKIWFCKDTTERREFLKEIGWLLDNKENTSIEVKQIDKEYPTIDIQDIETYTVSKDLSNRENSISMFRKNNTDHQKQLQEYLLSCNECILEALQGNTDSYLEYKSLLYLQRYKKKYYNLYIKMLNHRANNPSWACTGRGGLNVRRYNKKQDQYSNMIHDMAVLTEGIKEKINSIKWKVEKQQVA